MKKLLFLLVFLISGAVLIISFKPKSSVKNIALITPSDTISTLNGFTQSKANGMVTFCVGTTDNRPQNTQVWFRKEIVKAWYSLLQADSIRNKGKTDGLRIYMARTLPTEADPTHSNNRVVVVSTKFLKDSVEDGRTVKLHGDYFKHLDTNYLYKLKDINGDVSHDKDSTNGALLYNTCNCDVKKPCVISSDHDILRSQAEKMVQHFHRIIILRRGPINSQAEWFDMDMIRILLANMKADSIKKGIVHDGIRLYFARGVDDDYTKGYSKFVVVTTVPLIRPGTTKVIHEDYFECVHSISKKERQKILGGSFDNGELCPTNCSGLRCQIDHHI